MLGVTAIISTDLSAFPLVWVIPLAPDGVLALHISNRYYDLAPILGNAAKRLGMHAMFQIAKSGPDRKLAPGQAPSRVVLMAPDRAALARAATDPGWRPLAGDGSSVWTDDHANIFAAL